VLKKKKNATHIPYTNILLYGPQEKI